MTSSSVAAVCSYCGTTVARSDEAGREALENLGKISALVEDGSPLCVGAKGEYGGKRFEVVGRLQLEQESGFWNEWFLHYAGGATGWLGEALGQYFITTAEKTEAAPAFRSLQAGKWLDLAGKHWTVAEVKKARCTGSEGELPFVAGQGYELPYADLRGPDDSFATIDYSEDPPTVFLGRSVEWDALALKDHRDFRGW
jgi:hypothetical protein